jgi:hypothetical protein
MGEVVPFVSKAERERIRLIREARALYDSVFPRADPAREKQDKAQIDLTVSGANAPLNKGVLL